MRQFLILSNKSKTTFKIDSTAWERNIGDRMNIDGDNFYIVAIFKTESERNEVWIQLVRKIKNERSKANKLANRRADAFLISTILKSTRDMGMDEKDVIEAIKNLF